ncbi:MAG: branched-chain amino acid ABC transporter permease [Actinomycetota bacterium]|nr:branched-chain amino acid ABC transporter permease [Actinomycetota bacterium]
MSDTPPSEPRPPDEVPKTDPPERPDSGDRPRVGVDEWVASHEERRERGTGFYPWALDLWERLPAIAKLAVFVVPAGFFPLMSSNPNLFRYGIVTLIYALLALGLNIVVGYAGLLDLGYVAFLGFGAYFYGFLASNHSGRHWQAEVAIPLVVATTALLGLLLGLPSRRLVGDYLAIVTLFFLQAFAVFVNNANRIDFPYVGKTDVTGGPNGLDQIDPLNLFGWKLNSNTEYYYFALITFAIVMGGLYLLSDSRTGRALRALREDPLAAEAMSIPVNRLKLLAFALGAATAGFVGVIWGAVYTGAFPTDFDVPLLITVYAVLLLGGAGSLGGVVFGAIVINVVPELLRDPNNARWIFYGAIVLGLAFGLRPWRRAAAMVVGLIAFGLAVHAIADAAWPRMTARHIGGSSSTTGEALTDFLNNWMLLPSHPRQIANVAFVLAIVIGVLLRELPQHWRTIMLVPTLYIAAFAWENRLIQETAGATRLILLGALLVVLMNARPQGLFGTARVEIV